MTLNTDLRMRTLREQVTHTPVDDNYERRVDAAEVLHHFAAGQGLGDEDEVETVLTDLLADMLHLVLAIAPADPDLFDRSVERGRRHYNSEKEPTK